MVEKWTEMNQILTDLLGDLTIAVDSLKRFEISRANGEQQDASTITAFWRLCTFSIVINCCKFVELNDKYGKYFKELIPEHNAVRNTFKQAISNNRSITKLRNHCVAHVNNKTVYLSRSEVQKEIEIMFGDKYADQFLNWVCPDDIETSDKTKSLVGVIWMLRDAVSSKL